MSAESISSQHIEKETIPELKFPKEEVLSDSAAREERRKKLEQCMLLGNNSKVKVKIYFEDNTGLKEVETTVWTVSEEYISLKQNVMIPIKRIHAVNIL